MDTRDMDIRDTDPNRITDKNNSTPQNASSHRQVEQEFLADALKDSTRWIIWYLRKLVQAGDLYSRELDRRVNVSQPQLACLQVINEYGAMNLSQLAKYVLVKPSTVTGIIDRLEHKDLVARVRDKKDRRVVTIHLTEKGREFAESAPPLIPPSIIEGLSRLSEEETKMIVTSLSALVSMLDEDLESQDFHGG
jgi:DNA-binding MarR family transcriptional regulator